MYFQPWSFSLALDQRSADFFWKGLHGLHLTYSAPPKSYRNSPRQATHEQVPPAADPSCFPCLVRLFLQHSQKLLWGVWLGLLTHTQAHWDRSLVSCTSSRHYTTLVCLFTACLVMLPTEAIQLSWTMSAFSRSVAESKHLFLHIILACASVMLFKDGCSYFCCIALARDIAESCAISPVRVLWLLIQSSCYIISTSLTRPHLLEI